MKGLPGTHKSFILLFNFDFTDEKNNPLKSVTILY